MTTATIKLSVSDSGEPRVWVELPKHGSGNAARVTRRLAKKALMALARDAMKHTDDPSLLKRIFTVED